MEIIITILCTINILFMIFLVREFWELKKTHFQLIEANNNKPLEEGKHSFVIIELPSLNKYPAGVCFACLQTRSFLKYSSFHATNWLGIATTYFFKFRSDQRI
jgi:hypothetical protein